MKTAIHKSNGMDQGHEWDIKENRGLGAHLPSVTVGCPRAEQDQIKRS
jgi:hypothetical protein